MLRLLALAVCDVAAGVLALAGLIKLFDPSAFVLATTGLGVPIPRVARPWLPAIARLIGVGELLVVAAFVGVGGPGADALLGLAYAAFTAVAVRSLRSGSASCGCFGARSAPVTRMHVVINGLATAAALAVTIDGHGAAIVDRLGPLPAAVMYLVFVGTGVAVTVIAMTAGAELDSLRRRAPRTPVTGARVKAAAR